MKALSTAQAAHGAQLPEWIRLLAEQCDAKSQRAVADRIGYSPSVISQVIKGIYRGNIERVQQAVEGAFAGATVACPILGEIPRNVCLTHQRQKFSPTNPLRVRLYRACHGTCPHSTRNEDEEL